MVSPTRQLSERPDPQSKTDLSANFDLVDREKACIERDPAPFIAVGGGLEHQS
jgi:hypothetical protein